MRHGKKFNHLGRKAPHRKAMLANMACSLIEYKRIKTTVAKAKALRVYIEPLLSKSKNDTTHSRRTVFSYLKQKEAITELFGDIAAKIASRPGGYTRILKLSNRLGDNAEMCFIELVDYNEEYTTDKPKRKKTRRRGGANKVTETQTEEVVKTSEVEQEAKMATDKNVEKEEVKAEETSEETVAENTETIEATNTEEVVAPIEEKQEKNTTDDSKVEEIIEEDVVEEKTEETESEIKEEEKVEETVVAIQEEVIEEKIEEVVVETEIVEAKEEETKEEDTTEEKVEEVTDEKKEEVETQTEDTAETEEEEKDNSDEQKQR